MFRCEASQLSEDKYIGNICESLITIESGTIEVLEVGNTYEFKIDAFTEDGNSFEAHYRGSLQNFDELRPGEELKNNKKRRVNRIN